MTYSSGDCRTRIYYTLCDTIFKDAREMGTRPKFEFGGSFAKCRGTPPGGCLIVVIPPFEAERVTQILPDSIGFRVGVSEKRRWR